MLQMAHGALTLSLRGDCEGCLGVSGPQLESPTVLLQRAPSTLHSWETRAWVRKRRKNIEQTAQEEISGKIRGKASMKSRMNAEYLEVSIVVLIVGRKCVRSGAIATSAKHESNRVRRVPTRTSSQNSLGLTLVLSTCL